MENKTSKYLKYAIGEIVLVVIGILIALQINNWNENRKEYIKSKNYLVEILKDLEVDTITINRGIQFAQSFAADEKWALEKTNYTSNDVERLWKAIGGFYVATPLNSRTYDKIQNAGNSKLQGFDELYDKIAHYYTKVYNRYYSFYEYDKKVTLERWAFIADIDETVEISNSRMAFLGSETPIDAFPIVQDSLKQVSALIDFAKSPKGRNSFKYNYIRHLRAITVFNEVKSETIKLMSEINKTLEVQENKR